MLLLLCIPLLTGFLPVPQVKASCYFPDGVTVDSDGYPCNTSSSASVSQCCRTFEACLAGGACYTQWDSVMYRRSCTDRTFLDPACPRACLVSPFSLKNAVSLLRCQGNTDPTYCCQEDSSKSCCGNASSTFHFIPGAVQGILDASGSLGTIAGGGSTVYTPTGLSATATSSASPTTSPATPSPPLTTTPVSSPGASPSTAAPTSGTVIGLSVGISLAAVTAAAAFGGFLLYRQRQQKLESQQKQYGGMPAGPGIINDARHELPDGVGLSELTADRPIMK